MENVRYVFLRPQQQVVAKKVVNLAIQAGQQTGVEVKVLGFPGEEYETRTGHKTTLRPDKALIGVARESTPLEFQSWAERYVTLERVIADIKQSVRA